MSFHIGAITEDETVMEKKLRQSVVERNNTKIMILFISLVFVLFSFLSLLNIITSVVGLLRKEVIFPTISLCFSIFFVVGFLVSAGFGFSIFFHRRSINHLKEEVRGFVFSLSVFIVFVSCLLYVLVQILQTAFGVTYKIYENVDPFENQRTFMLFSLIITASICVFICMSFTFSFFFAILNYRNELILEEKTEQQFGDSWMNPWKFVYYVCSLYICSLYVKKMREKQNVAGRVIFDLDDDLDEEYVVYSNLDDWSVDDDDISGEGETTTSYNDDFFSGFSGTSEESDTDLMTSLDDEDGNTEEYNEVDEF